MVESLRPIFGARGYPDAADDIAALLDQGINVSLLFHGSDIRLPSRHAKRERWSPFTPGDEFTERLEKQARRHAELVDSLGLPVFVSTVDLLDDVPDAQWLPVAIDPAPWQQAARPLFSGERPVIAHVPSNAKLEGTEEIDAVLTGLHQSGQIEYRRITGVPHDRMPRSSAPPTSLSTNSGSACTAWRPRKHWPPGGSSFHTSVTPCATGCVV